MPDCARCIHYQWGVPVDAMMGVRLSSGRAMALREQREQELAAQATLERQRFDAGLPFDFEPIAFPYCARVSRLPWDEEHAGEPPEFVLCERAQGSPGCAFSARAGAERPGDAAPGTTLREGPSASAGAASAPAEAAPERLLIGEELSLRKTLRAAAPPPAPNPSLRGRPRYLAAWREIVLDPGLVREPQGFDYGFADSGGQLAIEGAGLQRLYVMFGASGMGKSHLLRKLLVRLAQERAGSPRWGGVLLDPKRSLLDDVRKLVPAERLVVIGSRENTHLNLLRSHLSPRDLGVALALAAQAAGFAGGDPYWLNEMKRIFSAGLMLLDLMGQPVTLGCLANLLLKSHLVPGKREGETQVESVLATLLKDAQEHRAGLEADDQRRLDNALSDLVQFSAAKGENADTVRSFLHQALAAFLDPDLDCVSDANQPDGVADHVFRDGKWLLLDVPRGSLASARMLATLTKVLFQRAALERDLLYPEASARRVFLAADEYAEVASDLPGEGFGDSIFFSQMRSARVLGLIATQGAPMLDNSGVKDTWKTILTNAGGKLFFRVDDHDTASLAASLAGEGDVIVADHNVGQSQGAAQVQLGRKLEHRPLLSTDLFLMGLARGQLVFVGCADGMSRSSVRYAKVEQ